MAKIKFRDIKLSKPNKVRLDEINAIIEGYQASGYTLTLRQLYYALVVRNIIPNQQREYEKLSKLLKEGRMAGIVDWNAITDRIRRVSRPPSWESPRDIVNACVDQYERPRMHEQDVYVEVWVEKDALSEVLERVTRPFHVPIMVNRGYSSASAMYDAYKRFLIAANRGQSVVILYVGDFDPSGLDMIRDIRDRIEEFIGDNDIMFSIKPIALTRAQIDLYDPPPNPAKLQDPRAGEFVDRHGDMSWEVDALDAEVLDQICRENIEALVDDSKYQEQLQQEKKDRNKLKGVLKYL